MMDSCYIAPVPTSIFAGKLRDANNPRNEMVKLPSVYSDNHQKQLQQSHVKTFDTIGRSINTEGLALSSRYTPYEWMQMNLLQYNIADTNRNYAEKLRSDAARVLRETEEKTYSSQRETCRRISERLNDIAFWRNELTTELERMLSETHLLQNARRSLEKTKQDCDPPLHIALDCMYFREGRQGIDKVRDQAEEALLQEISVLRNCQEKLDYLHRRVLEQLRENRDSQHELELDLKSKDSAFEIDENCYRLNNFSNKIDYYVGIEKFDQTISVPKSWAENSDRIVQRSQNRRIKSTQLRSESENTINECINMMWNAWNFTNSALSRRNNEILEAKNKLQMHLHKVQQEIFDVQKSIEIIKKAIADKSNPLKVAQTRLELRTHRRDVELCRDVVHTRLQAEVVDLETNIHHLKAKLNEAESQYQKLLITRSNLEKDLQLKMNSLFIDREKCLGIRKSSPMNAFVKY